MRAPPFLPRRWLLGAAAFGAISTWSSGLRAAPRSENAGERVRKKLVSLLHEPQRARQVGLVYLQSPPERLAPPPGPPLGLAETVLAEMGPDAGNEAIRRYIVARIRRELQDGQVISVEGWIMSPTEAQLCGLAAVAGKP
jgi:hypothetical protein